MIERWSASAGDPVSLDPAHAIYTLPQGSIPYALFDQLTTYDPVAKKVVPMLAQEYSSNDDATVWTFKLRGNATWHNGEPVLPSDVKYAWERVVNPATISRYPSLFSAIQGYDDFRNGNTTELSGVQADDAERALTVTMAIPFVDFPGLVTQLPFSPVPQKVVNAVAEGQRWDDQLMIGSGPFKMTEPWQHGRRIKVEKYKNYYRFMESGGTQVRLPKLAGIEFRVARDVDASFTELEAGIAHIAFTPPTRYQEIQSNPRVDIIDEPMSATWYLGFNMNNPVVGGPENLELRKAIALAIDREAVVNTVYQGGRRVGYTIVPPELPSYNADAAPVNHRDVAAAREAFAAWGGAAKLQQPLSFIYNIGSGQENVAAILKANLEEVGIPVEVKSYDSGQFPTEILKPDTQMFRQLITFTYPSADAGLYPLLHSHATGTNLTHYANPSVDAALDQARGTIDEQRRYALYQQAEAQALADFAIIPFFYYKAAGVVSKKLTGVQFMPAGYMNYSQAELH